MKVLLFLDVGGSMDPHVAQVEELFSAARGEFKHLEFFYFHNCPYERLWKDNRRRHFETTPTEEVLRTFPPDYRVVFVGDASMSPYELAAAGGSVEHWNAEPGQVWLQRILDRWPRTVWINPVRENLWGYTHSIGMIRRMTGMDRMVPLTLEGLERGMRELVR